MEEHVVFALDTRRVFDVTGTPALDLHTTASLLLDVLNIRATMTHNLGSQVETRHGFETYGDSLLWPFALFERIRDS